MASYEVTECDQCGKQRKEQDADATDWWMLLTGRVGSEATGEDVKDFCSLDCRDKYMIVNLIDWKSHSVPKGMV